MKRKNGKYNMKGGESNVIDTLITTKLPTFKGVSIGTTILVFIALIFIIILLTLLFINLTACKIMLPIMLILTLITYIVDNNKRTLAGAISNAIDKAVNVAQTGIDATNVSGFMDNVKKPSSKAFLIYILLGLAYIVSIILSVMSISTGRNENMDISTIIFKIFVFILTIISIISINFAIRKNFILPSKILFYITLPLIALSCADQNIFNISNGANIACSVIMALFMILIFTPLKAKLFDIDLSTKIPA